MILNYTVSIIVYSIQQIVLKPGTQNLNGIIYTNKLVHTQSWNCQITKSEALLKENSSNKKISWKISTLFILQPMLTIHKVTDSIPYFRMP